MLHLGGVGTLGLDKSTRPAGGDRAPGVDGIGDMEAMKTKREKVYRAAKPN